MADIIVTTPKQWIAAAKKEAEDARQWGGDTRYFRRFDPARAPRVTEGDRIYYAEDGFIRGFGIIDEVIGQGEMTCQTTGQTYPPGCYVYHRADSWRWIEPIPMAGFQGFRYAKTGPAGAEPVEIEIEGRSVRIVGGWLDPKPAVGEAE